MRKFYTTALQLVLIFGVFGFFLVTPLYAQTPADPDREVDDLELITPDRIRSTFPFIGCGGSMQQCCQPETGEGELKVDFPKNNANFIDRFKERAKQFSLFRKKYRNTAKCFFQEDEPVQNPTDLEGNAIIDKNGKPIDCMCLPKSNAVKNAAEVCEDYFDKENRQNINVIWRRDKTEALGAAEEQRLDEELSACKACMGGNGIYTALGCIPYDIGGIVSALIRFGIYLGGAYAVICITYGAVKIQMSRGDTSKISEARERITACIIGLVLVIFSVFIINFFGSGLLGFSITQEASEIQTRRLQCDRPCIYSDVVDGETKCFNGACPEDSPECGKPAAGGVTPINNGCTFAPHCGELQEVACP